MSDQKPRVGFGVMILKEGKVLLGKRHDDPEKADSELHGENTWTMPGGKLEFGKNFLEGCTREVAEETSLEIKKDKLELISLTDDILPDVHFVTAGFLCENFSGEPKVMEPDEITEWKWYPLDKLPDKVFPPSQKVLDHYNEGKIY
jgi:8-oxo-dGTP diphosphatase